MGVIYALVIGGVAGWLAGKLTKGSGFGLVPNIVLGVVGAILGHFLFGLLRVNSHDLLGRLLSATVGALLILYLQKSLAKR